MIMTKKKKSKKQSKAVTIHHFKNLETVRVFGIVRVSTDKQAKLGESLESQKEVLASWFKTKAAINAHQQWKLIELYVENEDGRGRSATTRDGRQGLAKCQWRSKIPPLWRVNFPPCLAAIFGARVVG